MRADQELLAEADEAHKTLSGPAMKKILEREFHHYGRGVPTAGGHPGRPSLQPAQGSLLPAETSGLSAHARGAGERRERRRPDPQGEPGYLGVDTVHQGDRDGIKGVYHVNAVDEVTQWQVVGAVPFISEAWLFWRWARC